MTKKRSSGKKRNYPKTNSKKLKDKKKNLSFESLIKSAPHAKTHRNSVIHGLAKSKKIIKIPKPKVIIKDKKIKEVKKLSIKKEIIKPLKVKQAETTIQSNTEVTETDFDKLVEYVNQKENVKLSQVAKIFKISAKTAEDWGKVLQNHSLVHIHYPTFGEPELRKWKNK